LTCAQVGDNRFSVPLFEDDLSNFLKNSPDANLVATVRDDMAVELFAARDIVAGEALSVNLSAAVSSA
jgi:xanthine dehydrogenase iron-sulfur cluster and FAD-binding subunit A